MNFAHLEGWTGPQKSSKKNSSMNIEEFFLHMRRAELLYVLSRHIQHTETREQYERKRNKEFEEVAVEGVDHGLSIS
jgi:hypothetical protein